MKRPANGLAQHVSAALGKPLSAEAARRLAAGVSGTAGDVFGALFELQAELSRPIGSDVRAVERYLASRAASRPTMRAILQTVAKYYRVPQKVLKSSSRRQSAVTARAMAIYLARELAGLSYERIGEAARRPRPHDDHAQLPQSRRSPRHRYRHPRGRRRFADPVTTSSTQSVRCGKRVDRVSTTVERLSATSAPKPTAANELQTSDTRPTLARQPTNT